MLFNSYGFVFVFFPLAFAGYCFSMAVGRKFWGNAFLLSASLIFYGWMHPEYLPVLICSMAFNYGLYWQMEKTEHKKWVLAAGIFLNLGALACLK